MKLKLIRHERQFYPGCENQEPYCDIDFFEDSIRCQVWSNGDVQWLKNNLLHRTDGYADYKIVRGQIMPGWFYLNGILHSRESWFEALTEEEQIEALFNIDEWR